MSAPPQVLSIDASDQADAYVIRVAGGLDLGGRAELESALADAERSPANRIVLDLDGLRFIDVSGLRTLVTASCRSADNGNRLRLTRGTGDVARLFQLTTLDLTLPFIDPAELP